MDETPLPFDELYQRLVELPRHQLGQIIDGELWVLPWVGPAHGGVWTCLSALVGRAFDLGHDGPGGWHIWHRPEVHLGSDVVVPDVAGWAVTDLPADLSAMREVRVAPRWVAEVLAPSNVALNRGKKLALYGRAGVRQVWFVDATRRSVEVFLRVNDGWHIRCVDGDGCDLSAIRLPPFDEIPLDLTGLWDRPPPKS